MDDPRARIDDLRKRAAKALIYAREVPDDIRDRLLAYAAELAEEAATLQAALNPESASDA
jgi:ribosomal protein L30E